jgi:hypothetical protein
MCALTKFLGSKLSDVQGRIIAVINLPCEWPKHCYPPFGSRPNLVTAETYAALEHSHEREDDKLNDRLRGYGTVSSILLASAIALLTYSGSKSKAVIDPLLWFLPIAGFVYSVIMFRILWRTARNICWQSRVLAEMEQILTPKDSLGPRRIRSHYQGLVINGSQRTFVSVSILIGFYLPLLLLTFWLITTGMKSEGLCFITSTGTGGLLFYWCWSDARSTTYYGATTGTLDAEKTTPKAAKALQQASWTMACSQYTKLHYQFIKHQGMTTTLRAFESLGLGVAAAEYAASAKARFLAWMDDPEFLKTIQDKDRFVAEGWSSALVNEMSEKFPRDVGICVEAATLAFVHGVLEDLCMECLRIAHLVRQDYFLKFVEKRKVSIEEIRAGSPDQLTHDCVEEYLKGLERESLMKKVEVLRGACGPHLKSGIVNYEFSEDRLEQADRARHDILHGLKWPKTKDAIVGHVDYLTSTGDYLLSLLNQSFDLKIQPELFHIFATQDGEALKPIVPAKPEGRPVTGPDQAHPDTSEA